MLILIAIIAGIISIISYMLDSNTIACVFGYIAALANLVFIKESKGLFIAFCILTVALSALFIPSAIPQLVRTGISGGMASLLFIICSLVFASITNK